MKTFGFLALFLSVSFGFKVMKLKHALEGILSAEELKLLVGAYDVVGDICIIIVPKTLEQKEHFIAEQILKNNRKIRVVAKRCGFYGGEFRTIPLQILAGENRKETEVREFGIRLLLNPETVYYSVRSGNERRRVASMVGQGESVLVLFSGVAPFPLIISKYSKAKTIVGIEKNPLAHSYAIENLKRNKKLKNIRLYQGDAKVVVATLSALFDRVIMPLPTRAEEFLPSALQVLKPGGVLHFYDLQRADLFDQSVEKIVSACAADNRVVTSTSITRCGHCAPRTYRICIDSKIC
jgi:tRNA (guanine37-N1)-methyltransferase